MADDPALFGLSSIEERFKALETRIEQMQKTLCENYIHTWGTANSDWLPEGTIFCVFCGVFPEPVEVDVPD